MKRYVFGIDPGVQTGLGLWDRTEKRLIVVETMPIHRALLTVLEKCGSCEVRVEDARQRKWFGSRDANQAKYGAGVREGAGSVKRDCTIWEDFCAEYEIPCRMLAPAARLTKWSPEYFEKVTGWTGRTSKHSRDAAVLCIRA